MKIFLLFNQVVQSLNCNEKKLQTTQSRAKISEALLKTGMKQKNIANQLQVHPYTISRELKRNVAKRGQTAGVYHARIAQKRYQNRHVPKLKHTIFDDAMK